MSVSRPVMVALAAVSTAASAEAQQKFDLICTGQQTGTRGVKAYNQVLHVDLMRRIYCEDTCAAWLPIKKIEAGRITFRDKPSDGYWLTDLAWWEPRTRRYRAHFAATTRAYTEVKIEGICRRTGMSVTKKNQ